MTERSGFAAFAQRQHPQLCYQVRDTETLTRERRAVLGRLERRPRVLELGCAVGTFSLAMQADGHDVTAIEGDPRAVAEARGRGVRVIEGDLEHPEAWDETGGGYDAVVAMHVLEHLADPWQALRHARAALAPGGVVVSLLPNVAAWPVRRQLFLRGRFDYGEWGILDRTHLRFFTLGSALDLHTAAGFGRVDWAPVDTRAPLEMLMRNRLRLRRLPRAWGAAWVRRFPNLCTEVFLFEATP